MSSKSRIESRPVEALEKWSCEDKHARGVNRRQGAVCCSPDPDRTLDPTTIRAASVKRKKHTRGRGRWRPWRSGPVKTARRVCEYRSGRGVNPRGGG